MTDGQELTQDGFNQDTDELLNKICDAYHEELKSIANKYGSVRLQLISATGLYNKIGEDTVQDINKFHGYIDINGRGVARFSDGKIRSSDNYYRWEPASEEEIKAFEAHEKEEKGE